MKLKAKTLSLLPPPVRARCGENAAIRPIPAKHGGRR